MKLIENMADKLRNSLKDFLEIEPANQNVITIREKVDLAGEQAKHRIWYRGDADELAQLYKLLEGSSTRSMFWSAVPSTGHVRKIHTGLPGLMVDVLASIVKRDMNGIKVSGETELLWEEIAKENILEDLIEDAISDILVIGDGAFKINYNPEISKCPIIEWISGENVDYKYQNGKVVKVSFRTTYTVNRTAYTLIEEYSRGRIENKLYKSEKLVPLNAIEETVGLEPVIEFGDYMLAIPLRFGKSHKWKGRGCSVFASKCDNFDSFDEIWSQWMEAIRMGRANKYIPENMLPRNPNSGEVMKPNSFDNQYIQTEASMMQGAEHKITVTQPAIPHDSYLASYITALDLCLQGIISPSTLGIDTKKLDNAEAQREKEKTTLYTRNKLIEIIQDAIPEVVKAAVLFSQNMSGNSLKEPAVVVDFGEYANPSFESQVETISKAKGAGIMSIDASIDELYGDTKDEEWKSKEITRIKSEQGIEVIDELTIDD